MESLKNRLLGVMEGAKACFIDSLVKLDEISKSSKSLLEELIKGLTNSEMTVNMSIRC